MARLEIEECVRLAMTQQETSELVGTGGDTIMRLLSEFGRHDLPELKGSTLIIHSRPR
ncbi:MAG TPA: hypothetical protein VN946_13220 [Terriglobales bacterium]|jgi:CRP-like cAMP-binding protein|nr:hypothetical protein [Terriglobales bacterium]